MSDNDLSSDKQGASPGGHLAPIPEGSLGDEPAGELGAPTAEAVAGLLRWLANHRGRSGRITSPETIRSGTCALPVAFAGSAGLGQLADAGRAQLHANIRAGRGIRAPATFNVKRVACALSYFQAQGGIPDARIERLVTGKHRPVAERALFSMLYSTAARAGEVLRLGVADLDRADRRARTLRKGGAQDQLLDDIRTARLLGQLLGRRRSGPVFLPGVETPTASLDVTRPREIRLYATMFQQFGVSWRLLSPGAIWLRVGE